MKILVVNLYKSENNLKLLIKFIRSLFSNLSGVIDGEIEFLVRKPTELSDLVCDHDVFQNLHPTRPGETVNHKEGKSQKSVFGSVLARKMFDRLDFVFIDSDSKSSFAPWQEDMDTLMILIKNCLRTNKCVFGSNVVFNSLIFLCH
jgi:hypothetical protein